MKARGLILRQFYHTGDDGIERPSGAPFIPWWTKFCAGLIVLILFGLVVELTQTCEDRARRVKNFMDMSSAYRRAGDEVEAERYRQSWHMELREFDQKCAP